MITKSYFKELFLSVLILTLGNNIYYKNQENFDFNKNLNNKNLNTNYKNIQDSGFISIYGFYNLELLFLSLMLIFGLYSNKTNKKNDFNTLNKSYKKSIYKKVAIKWYNDLINSYNIYKRNILNKINYLNLKLLLLKKFNITYF